MASVDAICRIPIASRSNNGRWLATSWPILYYQFVDGLRPDRRSCPITIPPINSIPSSTMGGARGGGRGAAAPLCPPTCPPSAAPPLVRIMTLGALQGFSIFCKKQLNVLKLLNFKILPTWCHFIQQYLEIILLHYLSLAELAKVCVDK